MNEIYPLTPRQREVLVLVCDGLSNKEIGARLGMGEDTAKHHVETMIDRWGIDPRTRTKLAVTAVRLGYDKQEKEAA